MGVLPFPSFDTIFKFPEPLIKFPAKHYAACCDTYRQTAAIRTTYLVPVVPLLSARAFIGGFYSTHPFHPPTIQAVSAISRRP